MLMKMHSYMAVNGYLQCVNAQSLLVLDQLREATTSHGGWEQCVRTAKLHRAEMDTAGGHSPSVESTPAGTPLEIPDGTKKSFVDVDTANALRKRLAAAAAGRLETPLAEDAETVLQEDLSASRHQESEARAELVMPQILVDHPVEMVAALAKEYLELEAELTSPGPEAIRWPNNITFKNFAVYQLIPTLVYELEYPRTDQYVCEHRPFVNPLTVIQYSAFVSIRENRSNFWDLCLAVHCDRKFHHSSDAYTRSIALPVLT
jgi:sterol O-acyltransferase